MAWGTAGFKSLDWLPGIPNTDPLRLGHQELPPESCSVSEEDTLSYLTATAKQYYLAPNFSVEDAELLSLCALNIKLHSPLLSVPIILCWGCHVSILL